METKICLDTDFLVNFLRNKEPEVTFIKNHEVGKELATTLINLFELYHGAYKSEKSEKNLKSISLLRNRITLLNFSEESVRNAGQQFASLEKKGKKIDFRDLFIGTISSEHNFALKTYNKKDFSRIKGLRFFEEEAGSSNGQST